MIISLVTGGLTMLNAALFLLLAPGKALSSYIAASSIYGTTLWLNAGILPVAWQFDRERMATLRRAQLWVASGSAILLLATQTLAIAIGFSVLLALESYFFFTSILLMESRTTLFQRLELVRAILYSVSLALAVGIFHSDPVAYVWGMIAVSVGSATLLHMLKLYTPPRGRGRVQSVDVLREMRRALDTGRLRALLTSRGIEIISVLALNWSHRLGMIIALKIGLAISYSLSSNARRYSAVMIVAAAAGVYVAGMIFLLAIGRVQASWVPRTFHVVTWTDAVLVTPAIIACLTLVLIAYRTPDAATETVS